MLKGTSASKPTQIDAVCAEPSAGLPTPRVHPIRSIEDYGIDLPAWLQECLNHVPPGVGYSCPTDSEALLAAAFNFAFQLHEGQFRASGDPYICLLYTSPSPRD